MTKEVTVSSNTYLITPSLLNSWAYMWLCIANVKEAENDTISLEDKQLDAIEKAKEDFINTLNRVPSEPNFFMKQGIEFEDACYRGETCVSPIIEGGAYQIVGKKIKKIGDYNFLLYGRLDVLKGGTIYDIKRVMKYAPQKYLKSYQHPFYFELFHRAKDFKYLVYDGKDLHIETYYRDQCVNIDDIILMFIQYLKDNNYLSIYLEKWKAKGEK